MTLVGLLHGGLLGLAITTWAWGRRSPRPWPLVVSLGVPLGLGAGALLELVLLVSGARGGPAWWGAQVATGTVAVSALVVGYRVRGRERDDDVFGGERAAEKSRGRVLPAVVAWASVALLAVPALLALLMTSRLLPSGDWDGWAIWGLRAAFLFSGDAEWGRAFDPTLYWSHPDYPLLLPMTLVRSWRFLGDALPAAPAAVSLLATAWVGVLLFASVRELRGRIWAVSALAALLTFPRWILEGAGQKADMPLALMLLSAGCLLAFNLESEHLAPPSRWILFGALLGCAAWTKNEGQSLALALVLALGVPLVRRDRGRAMGWILLGLLPFLSAVAWQRTSLYGETYVLSRGDETASVAARVTSPERHGAILKEVGRGLPAHGRATGALALLGTLALLSRSSGSGTRGGAGGVLAVGVLIHAAFCYGVYLVTPTDLEWLVSTSWHRLLLQVWPTLLLIVALWGRPLDEGVEALIRRR